MTKHVMFTHLHLTFEIQWKLQRSFTLSLSDILVDDALFLQSLCLAPSCGLQSNWALQLLRARLGDGHDPVPRALAASRPDESASCVVYRYNLLLGYTSFFTLTRSLDLKETDFVLNDGSSQTKTVGSRESTITASASLTHQKHQLQEGRHGPGNLIHL